MSETVLPTALAFARHGHAVFPVNWPVDHNGKLLCSCGSDSRGRPCGRNAAKHPYGKLAPHGLLSATTDSGIIKHWFGYAAPEANLGVVTDRLVVLDIDPRHGGDESNCDYALVLGMLHAWNTAWCKPPLGYQELNRVVARIADKEAARIEQELAR
jgi:hypothetical protein